MNTTEESTFTQTRIHTSTFKIKLSSTQHMIPIVIELPLTKIDKNKTIAYKRTVSSL